MNHTLHRIWLFSVSGLILIGLSLPAGACDSGLEQPQQQPQQQPRQPLNVLLILVDDLKPTMGCYGDPHAKTPNMDRLAARGMRFDLAYCNHAICAASRFNLMLGSHSSSTGLYGLGQNLREFYPDAVTLPQHFAKHGYRTESMGKVFHIGHGNRGDDSSFTVTPYKDKVIEYLEPASTDGKLTREEAMFTNQPAKGLERGAAFESPDVADNAYADGRVAEKAIERLQFAAQQLSDKQEPFFMAVGFARPHLPFSAPKKYWELHDPTTLPLATLDDLPEGAPQYAGKNGIGGEMRNYFPTPEKGGMDADLQRKMIHGYYASTSYVDAQIGKVLTELERLGLAKSTIVVLWGDHGYHLGDHGMWTKHTNYEQANRIPLLIAAPGITKPESKTKHLVGTVDIYPTLSELAGLPAPTGPPTIDGISLVPVLKEPATRLRDHVYHCFPSQRMGRSIRTERFRLVEWRALPGAPEQDETAEFELYDYREDPNETRSLLEERPAAAKKLQAILNKYPKPVTQGTGQK